MRFASYRPSLLDHLPMLRRGHGGTHTRDRRDRDGRTIRKGLACVQSTCALMFAPSKDGQSRGELHEDQKGNADDWKIDHGLSYLDPKSGVTKAIDTPFERCFRR